MSAGAQGETKPLILVVDDDTAIRELVREALELFQFAVGEAGNGAEGVKSFSRLKPELRSGRMGWSQETYRIFGVDPQSFTPDLPSYLERVHPLDREIVARATGEAVRREGPYSFDARIIMPDGTERFVHEQAEAIFDDDGTPLRLAGTTQDITERKQIEDQIRFLAYYDGLTRLPNRVLFVERLNQALASAARQGRVLAMLFLDLDRFKR